MPYANQPLNLGIGAQLTDFATKHPDKVAIYDQQTEITYEQFLNNIIAYQQLLITHLDQHKNQKVALLLSNEPIFLEVYFAVIMLGWTAIPFDPRWTNREAEQIKDIATPDLIITNQLFKQAAKYQFANAFVLGTLTYPDHKKVITTNANNDFYLGFTSGSSGFPKGFVRNHESWLKSFEAGETVFNYDQNDIIMAPGPLNHSLSLFGATHALHMGASFCLTSSFSATKVSDLIHQHRVTVLYGVPTMLHSLAQLKSSYDKPITFLASGAKLQQEVKHALEISFPKASLYEYYGASELSYVTYATDALNKKYPDSVGLPFPSVKLTIRNSAGEELPTNHIGEIYVESDFIFSRYVNNEQATQETLTEYGAFIGDIGFINEVGALTVVGRKNNMIITGGQNVYPEEVEHVLKQAESVKDAIIIGVQDTHWGERIIALIIWQKQPNLAAVRQLCKEQLSVYKRPRKYITVESFPYTHTGKVARQDIKNQLKEWIK